MAIEINTKVSLGETYGKKIGNMVLEDAKFWGRPNFRGELDRFKDERRKFTVLIPNDLADQLREMGWNVKTEIPTAEQREQGFEDLSHMKVFMNFSIPDDKKGRKDEYDFETGPDIHIIQGDDIEKLNSKTVGLLDRARLSNLDMEIRAWEYDPEEQPGKYSARLEKLVATLTPNRLDEKYGRLR